MQKLRLKDGWYCSYKKIEITTGSMLTGMYNSYFYLEHWSFYNKPEGTIWASLNLSGNLDNEIDLFTSLEQGFA
jgi:hypothetical protein